MIKKKLKNMLLVTSLLTLNEIIPNVPPITQNVAAVVANVAPAVNHGWGCPADKFFCASLAVSTIAGLTLNKFANISLSNSFAVILSLTLMCATGADVKGWIDIK